MEAKRQKELAEINRDAVRFAFMAYEAAKEMGADEGTAQGILGTAQRFWLHALMSEATIDLMKMDKMTRNQPQQ
jgi:hypothetical protein